MKRSLAICLVGIAVVIWALTWTNTETYIYEPVPKIEAVEVKAEIKKPQLRKELVPICACESTGNKYGVPTQFKKDGVTVLLGKVNPKDIGMCQINLTANGATAKKMGLDVFKESDNIIFANWLFSKKGSQPWNWSKHCWQ